MKVLIIGGTGTISSEVARVCSENDMEVTTFTRGTGWRSILLSENCRNLFGDIRNEAEFRSTIQNDYFDVILDFYSYLPEHLQYKLGVLENHYRQYIFISSLAAYNPEADSIISETYTSIGPSNNKYGWNKALCECYLREYFKRKKQYFTIVRPGFMYGNTGVPYPITEGWTLGGIALLERIRNGGTIPVFWDDDVRCRILHVNDFAKKIINLIFNEKAFNEDFHIVSKQLSHWNTILDIIGDKMDCHVNKRLASLNALRQNVPGWKHSVNQAINTASWDIDCTKYDNLIGKNSLEKGYDEGVAQVVEFFNSNFFHYTKFQDVTDTIEQMNYTMDKLCRI